MTNGEAPEGAERLDLDAIEARREAAHEMINDLCQRRRDWVMSIPARPNHDPDLVIGASLRDGIRLVAEVRRLSLELERCQKDARILCDDIAERARICAGHEAEVRRLHAALEQADVVMETAALSGVRKILAPAYSDSWAAAHRAVKEALEGRT